MEQERIGAGGVIITSDYDNLKQWVITSLENYDIESHGEGYSQQFILQKINDTFSICFYRIDGYDTAAENVAFEHAEFIIDGFLDTLEENSPSENYLAFADAGITIEEDEFIGFKSLAEGLNYFKAKLTEIEILRVKLPHAGEVIWES